MEKKITLVIVAAFLIIAAAAAVVIIYNANDDNEKPVRVSAAELMPDIEEFPTGWEKGPIVSRSPPNEPTFIQSAYTLSGARLVVNIAVCAKVADAKDAFESSKIRNTPVTDHDDNFEQCFKCPASLGGTTVVLQHKNVYGVLELWNTGTPLTPSELDVIIANIEEKILDALK